jgi:peptidoglycan-N-acetylglucosamine deacetylase
MVAGECRGCRLESPLVSVRKDGERSLSSELSTHDLHARRAAWRRRRTRRRVAGSALVLAAAPAVFLTLGLHGTPDRSEHRTRLASRTPPAELHLAGPPHSRQLPAGAPPVAPIERVLSYTSYVTVGTARKREVALTFDDGPGPYTPQILGVLERAHAPATFFAIGEWASRYPQVVRAEARAGFEIGDHTETHPFMTALPAAAQRAEIVDAAVAIQRAGGPFPHLWRPPYGAFNATTLEILRALKMLVVLWTVDTSDYARPGVSRIEYTAISGARPGAIILMHDGGGDRSETVAALPRIIAAIRRHGYRLVTVSQLVADDPPPRHQPAPQPLSGLGR